MWISEARLIRIETAVHKLTTYMECIMSNLDDLQAEVTAQTALIGQVLADVAALHTQLQDALNNSNAPQMQNILAALRANDATLAAAHASMVAPAPAPVAAPAPAAPADPTPASPAA